jgi:hypothetical protein
MLEPKLSYERSPAHLIAVLPERKCNITFLHPDGTTTPMERYGHDVKIPLGYKTRHTLVDLGTLATILLAPITFPLIHGALNVESFIRDRFQERWD